jgi:signal transduction histidine kinase
VTKQIKRIELHTSGEADVTEDLTHRIQSAKLELNTALLSGQPTGELRHALRELEADRRKIEAASAERDAAQHARQAAAQRAEQEEERQRIADAAQALADARDNRLAVLATRYAIPFRSMSPLRSSS